MDRAGRSLPRAAIHRIAVVKPDHIGDLLIASRAFSLLRHFFPAADIDLICGPWNVELARKLGLFSDVHGVNLFHEVSGQQQDAAVARAMWRKGVKALQSVGIGAYDLAIDLRHDRDSRPLLLSLDAKIYAGYGTIKEYPFLDIVLPTHTAGGGSARSDELFLTGRQFHRVATAIETHGFAARGSGVIATARDSVELDLLVKGALSPAACGTIPGDMRELGIALRTVTLEAVGQAGQINAARPVALSHRDPAVTLLSGWASQEDWGVWGLGRVCRLRVALPPAQGEDRLRVGLSLLGHVNQANPVVECTVQVAGEGESEGPVAVFRNPFNEADLAVEVPRFDAVVRLASEPFRLAPGSYRGMLRVYIPVVVTPDISLHLTLRGLDSAAALMTCAASAGTLRQGLCDIVFCCDIETGDEPLSLEIETHHPRSLEGTRIEMLAIECVEPMKLNGPVGHMEQHACMLVLRVALEFSDQPPFGADDIAARLTAPAVQIVHHALEELRGRIAGWQDDGFCVVGIALGCNTEIRKWPLNYFIDLANDLLGLGRVKLLFIGGPADQPEAEEACRALRLAPAVHSACGKTKLHELGRLLQPLDLFIGSNTGTTHFAGRVGVRTVGIYAGTNHPREWGPIGDNASWISRDEKCAPCSLTDIRDCRFGHVCLRDLLPAHVLPVVVPEILQVLSARAPAAAA